MFGNSFIQRNSSQNQWLSQVDTPLPTKLIKKAVHVHLPGGNGYSQKIVHFFIIVDTQKRKQHLSQFISKAVPKIYNSGTFGELYAKVLLQAKGHIISLREDTIVGKPIRQIEEYANLVTSKLHYSLYQKSVAEPYQKTPVHLSRQSKISLCGRDCSGYHFMGRIQQEMLVDGEYSEITFCAKCIASA